MERNPTAGIKLSSKQVAARLQAEISAGAWPPGSALPSQTAIARRFGVTRTRAQLAITRLVANGTVISQGAARPALVAGDGVQAAPSSTQVAARLASEISAGRWPPGSALPTQAAIARRFGVNPAVAEAAIGRLVADGKAIRRGRPRPALVAGTGAPERPARR